MISRDTFPFPFIKGCIVKRRSFIVAANIMGCTLFLFSSYQLKSVSISFEIATGSQGLKLLSFIVIATVL